LFCKTFSFLFFYFLDSVGLFYNQNLLLITVLHNIKRIWFLGGQEYIFVYLFSCILYKLFLINCRGLSFLLDVKLKIWKYQSNGDTVVSLFQKTVAADPDKVAMVMIDEQQWTFREMDEYSNKVANYFFEQGYRKVRGSESLNSHCINIMFDKASDSTQHLSSYLCGLFM